MSPTSIRPTLISPISSVRDQLAAHREEASCKDCHRGIDPWGIPMENYGGDGLWRDNILRKKTKGKGMNKLPVETETILPDGTRLAASLI